MPELPEVERGRRLAARIAEGKTIAKVVCADDNIVFDGVSAARFRRALKGKRVVAVRRRGKQLWFDLDVGPHPLFHFGMTGAFRAPDATPIELASSPKGGEPAGWPPRFTKIRLTFDDGSELAMTNARRLGRILLRDDPRAEPPLSRLGFDALDELPTAPDLAARLARRRIPIKALLLDQKFAAGVGNWIADEVLFQARIAPARAADSLALDEVKRLRAKIKSVISTAVAANADKTRFPRTWLFHRRWGKDADAVTTRGDAIAFTEVGGRTTAWVPAVQK